MMVVAGGANTIKKRVMRVRFFPTPSVNKVLTKSAFKLSAGFIESVPSQPIHGLSHSLVRIFPTVVRKWMKYRKGQNFSETRKNRNDRPRESIYKPP